jgi:hypothetical protein
MIFMPTANLYRTNAGAFNHMPSSNVVLAVLGTLSLEFTRLSQITGNNKYFDAIQRVMNELDKWQDKTTLPGMWPAIVDTTIFNESMSVGSPSYGGFEIYTLGALADSAYEYLPKVGLLSRIVLTGYLTTTAIPDARRINEAIQNHVRKVRQGRQGIPHLSANDRWG